MDRYTVYSLRIANELIKLGFPMVGAKPNEFYEDKVVFYFEESNELKKAIEGLK